MALWALLGNLGVFWPVLGTLVTFWAQLGTFGKGSLGNFRILGYVYIILIQYPKTHEANEKSFHEEPRKREDFISENFYKTQYVEVGQRASEPCAGS